MHMPKNIFKKKNNEFAIFTRFYLVIIEFFYEEKVLLAAIATLANALLFPVLLIYFHVNTNFAVDFRGHHRQFIWTAVSVVIRYVTFS